MWNHQRSRSQRDRCIDRLSGISGTVKPKSDRTILIQNDQHTKEGFLYEQEVKKYMATAIEEDLFEVYYQPLYDLKEKDTVQWKH